MHLDQVIKDLKVKQYGYNDVVEVLQSVTAISNSKIRPKELKKHDVIRTFEVRKARPGVIIKVLEDVVIVIPLSTTEDCINLCESKSRFFGEGFFSRNFVVVCKDEAMQNFLGVYDNPKLVNQACKLLKEFTNKIL